MNVTAGVGSGGGPDPEMEMHPQVRSAGVWRGARAGLETHNRPPSPGTPTATVGSVPRGAGPHA